ncbi:MAG: TIGR03663 family protein [Planctomycetes bacterium]|nr:TIGR03663 family protein [Planctomycetota bacterium]
MMTRKTFLALLLLIAAGALALRLVRLDYRPMHCDEAVHTLKFDTLWRTGVYQYDLNEYHGPTLYYSALPVAWLSGVREFTDTSEVMFRLVPVLFGVGLILLLGLIADGLGRGAVLWAGVLTALSPAMVYYSRYYIQEMLLVFFTFVVLAAGWRYVRSRRVGWALWGGAAVGLMHATKETCIIQWGALLMALGLTMWWRGWGRADAGSRRPYLRPAPLVGAAAAAVCVSVLFFSGFFTNPVGPLDSLRAFGTYFGRAGGDGIQEHPWYYYLRMLAYTRYPPAPVWTEALVLVLAAVGAAAAVRGIRLGAANVWLVRFLVLYTALMIVVYSAVPYKTPWSMLGFLHGLILLAGVGVTVLLGWVGPVSGKVVVAVVLLAGLWNLGGQAWRGALRFSADNRNPYAYAHPVRDVLKLVGWVERLAAVHPDGRDMVVKIIADDYWPLPWYLRGYGNVGYWEQPPADADADVIVAGTGVQANLAARLERDYLVSVYGLRPSVKLLVYADRRLYEAFAAQQPRSAGEIDAGAAE